ncbi:uncharacterized protein G2W53_039495 [Senna tora]|uniref:Uncharacterized protein n=1 Tax=Senna tora TaxID=362788 RepID=A0A834W807_9FABA|nr:uncharacterized protein G2W53_039495 [Senna tora]
MTAGTFQHVQYHSSITLNLNFLHPNASCRLQSSSNCHRLQEHCISAELDLLHEDAVTNAIPISDKSTNHATSTVTKSASQIWYIATASQHHCSWLQEDPATPNHSKKAKASLISITLLCKASIVGKMSRQTLHRKTL